MQRGLAKRTNMRSAQKIPARPTRRTRSTPLPINRLFQTLHQLHDVVVIVDPQGKIQHFSAGAERLLGWKKAEVCGRTAGEIYGAGAAEMTAAWKSVRRKGTWNGELHFLTKAGRPLAVRSRWIRLKDPAGGPLVAHLLADITAHKQAEKILRTQRDFGIFLSAISAIEPAIQQLLKIALEHEGIDLAAVYLANPRTGLPQLAARLGLTNLLAPHVTRWVIRAVAQGQLKPNSILSRDTAPGVRCPARQFQQAGLLAMSMVPFYHEGKLAAVLWLGSKTSRIIPAHSTEAMAALATQTAAAFVRIRAEQLLRANQQLLEKTLHSHRAAVLLVDAATGVIQRCNHSALSIFGYPRAEMEKRTTAFLYRDPTEGHRLEQLLHAETTNNFETYMRRKDGTLFPAEQSALSIKNEEEDVLSWLTIIRDISERKQMEKELRDWPQRLISAQEAERRRVARELHDGVNQIIASAKMRLHRVEGQLAGGSPVVLELLTRCRQLLVEALEENRRIAYNLRPTDLEELGLVAACENLCQGLQGRTNLKIKIHSRGFEERLSPEEELHLYRIVQEALQNVEEHAGANNIRLRLGIQDNAILLEIIDDGAGFSPDHIKPIAPGRGLGLTNMRERVACLGGSWELHSAPGQGTAITIRLPRHAFSEEPARTATPSPFQSSRLRNESAH